MRVVVRRLLTSPLIKRVIWHGKRITSQVDPRFFLSLFLGLAAIVGVAGLLVTVIEKDVTVSAFLESFYWGVTTVLGQGEASYVTSIAGFVVSWLLALFGVAIVATITGALIGFVIDFLLKEGQGMGASGYEGHVVICGWNPTARELVEELRIDDYKARVVIHHDAERNPVSDGEAYFVRGDTTKTEDLRRAGIEQATAAIVCPASTSDDADMRSILTVLAIETIAPTCRTVVEVNNPNHVLHFERADVDEILVTSKLTSRLLARTAMYPGLTDLVTDIVSGGEGSELYRVHLPDDYIGISVDELSARMRAEHSATLLAVNRDGRAFVNPPTRFRLEPGDTAVVVAESLGTLMPLEAATTG